MANKNTVLWFRKGLRLHDNPALVEACKAAQHVYPIFIIDPHFLQNSSYKVGVNRYNFLLESLTDLDNSLRARGSRLLVLRGQPLEVLPKLFKEWQVQQLCYEADVEPYAKSRDAAVAQLAADAGVAVSAHVSHTLYDTDYLIRQAGGKAPLTMQSFTKLIDGIGPPPAPVAAPAAIPAPDEARLRDAQTDVPTLAECGFTQASTTIFKGGETQALARLESYLSDSKWVCGFEKPATDPSAFEKPATTVLSPYLKFGCLSPRLFHQRLLALYRASKGAHSKPPVSLRGQLLWREFFYTVGSSTANFDRMAGNPLAKQIPWDTNPELLAAWKEGRTGYPWIDAAMRQLAEWGWMHHLARHSVACFLTRGDLYLSWEAGKDVFEELLLDAVRGWFGPGDCLAVTRSSRVLGWDEARSLTRWSTHLFDGFVLFGLSRAGPLPQRCQLDVAVSDGLLQPVLPRLLAGHLWQEVRPGGQVHPPLCAAAGPAARQVYLRALDRTTGRAAEVRLRHRQGLPLPHRGPHGHQQDQHGTHEGRIRGQQSCKRSCRRRRRQRRRARAAARRWQGAGLARQRWQQQEEAGGGSCGGGQEGVGCCRQG